MLPQAEGSFTAQSLSFCISKVVPSSHSQEVCKTSYL